MVRRRGHAGRRAGVWAAVAALAAGLLLQALAPLLHRHAGHGPEPRAMAGGAVRHTASCRSDGEHSHDHALHAGPGHADTAGASHAPDDDTPPEGPHEHDCDLCRLIATARPAIVPGIEPALVRLCEPPALILSGAGGRAGGAGPRTSLARGPPTG